MPFNDVQSPFMPNSGVFTVVEPLQQSGSCGFDFTDINFDALLQQASNLGAEGFSYDPFIT